MRSAEEMIWRTVAVALTGAALAGCSTISDSMNAVKEAVMPSSAPASEIEKVAAAGAATVPGGVKPAAVTPAAPLVPVSANAQRAFDDALRLLKAGRTDEAERGFKALTVSNPELGGPHANLGVIYRQAGKLDDAAAELEKATKASPNQPVYWNQLGVTYRQLGQFQKSRDAYEQAIALDPNYAAPTLNLGILNDLYLGDPKRALELYDRYLALSPNGDAQVTKWVAELKNRKGAAARTAAAVTVSKKEQ
jgi:tetratricopeptide (TPR) repeat protein